MQYPLLIDVSYIPPAVHMSDDEVAFEEAVREMRRRFLVPPPPNEVFSRFDGLVDGLNANYQPLAAIFRHNLSSVLSSVSIPFTLAHSAITDRHWQRIHTVERIRSLKIGPDRPRPGIDKGADEDREREAYKIATWRMKQFEDSGEGQQAVIQDVCTFLLSGVRSDELKLAASGLIEQGVILIWSAFEVLFRDTFELVLNLDPSKVEFLAEDTTTRKRFEVERFHLDTLINYKFDLSDKLGTVLVGQQDFSDLPLIKSVYSVLFPSAPDLTESLGQPNLWLLYQRRHLFVHRRGIIDQTYLNNTGEPASLGSTLVVTPDEFEEQFNVVLKTGEALFQHILSKTTT